MKKIMLLNLILVVVCILVDAQSENTSKQDLQSYIEIRRNKFNAYSQSLEKRSGFFGNKTKNDLQKSHDALADIVETDNHIISFLNQKIDVKKYEKANLNFDFLEQNEQIRNLQLAADTLVKQVDLLAASNIALKNKAQFLKWSVYILSGLILWMFFQKWKCKSSIDSD